MDRLEKTGLKTPQSRSIEAKAWESWCYQVKMEGYLDSEIIHRHKEAGDRRIHFTLIPRPTIQEIITSNPPGAEIYWGKSKEKLEKTGLKTPQSRSIEAKAWESWCYQVKMEGYLDSEVIQRHEEAGDRRIHFTLIPRPIIQEIITSNPPGAEIYWGKSKEKLEKTGLRTPFSRSLEVENLEGRCYQIKKKGYVDSKVICRPDENRDRLISFILKPTPEKIKKDNEARISAYIEKQRESSELKPKDSFSDKAYNYFQGARTASSNPDTFLTNGTSSKMAIELLNQAIGENPYYHAAHYILGLSLYREENYEKAEDALLKSTELKPKYQPAYVILGDVYVSLKKYNNAIIYYNKALEKGNSNLNIYYQLGNIYLHENDLDNAETSYLKALKILGDKRPEKISDLTIFLYIHNMLTEIYLRKGDLKSSWEHVKISPPSDDGIIALYQEYAGQDDFYAIISLGRIYYSLNMYRDAIDYFEMAMDIDQDKFDQYYELGTSLKALKQYRKAIRYLDKALELDHLHYYANLQLGILLSFPISQAEAFNLKPDYGKSIELFKNAIEINPNDAVPYYYLGKVYLYTGRERDALEQTKKALNIEQDYATLFQLGDIYFSLKEYSNAAESYQKALKLNDNSSIRLSFANCLIYLKDYDQAIAFLEESVSLYPGNILLLNKLGDIFRDQGDFAAAISKYKEILELETTSLDIYFLIASSYSSMNGWDNAEQYLLKAISISPKSFEANYNCGIVYINKGQYNNAMKYLARALSIKPDDKNTKEMIRQYQHKIDISDLKEIKESSLKGDEEGIFTKLLLNTVEYNKGNDLWIRGTKETEFKDGKNIVSPKIYEALGYFEKMKDLLRTFPRQKVRIREALNFLNEAIDLRISGIKQHSEGYYIKESEYNGEYEKGRAKISLADDRYVDFLILLKEESIEHDHVYSGLVNLYLEYNLEYYKKH